MAHRAMFLHIGQTWIFYVSALVAVVLFIGGLVAYIQLWRRIGERTSVPLSWPSIKETVADVMLGKRLFRGDLAAGLMHFFIFWGFSILFIGTALLSVHHYIIEFLHGPSYLVFSFMMELAGIMLATGVLWAAVRRYVQGVKRLESKGEDGLVLIWLSVVIITGFLLEALRLAFEQPSWGGWSFVGEALSGLISASTATSLYPYLWWSHAGVSLGLIAVIPFTKLFHMLGAPACIYLQKAHTASIGVEEGEGNRLQLKDLVFFDACMRCGRCVEACPSTGAGEPFAPRDFVQAMRKALWNENSPIGDIRIFVTDAQDAVEEKLWYCTTCRACLEVCPIYGATFEEVVNKRVDAIEDGTRVPQLLIQTLERLYKYNNPWEASKKKRAAWAKDLDMVDITKSGGEVDFCYFVGCTTSFDTRAQEIARSLTRILEISGVSFGILGKKEPCCGDIARRVGELGLFQEQVEGCEELFEKYKISKIVTSSPHCFHTFKNDYPQGGVNAIHYAILLDQLIRSGAIRPNKPIDATVTYHDPCYLGRHNGVFEEPRRVIRAIAGINFKEMPHCRADSLCCGGGGGRMWQEELDADIKMSEIRIREAHDTGAQILITACPLCLIMLEDARKTQGLEQDLKVMDLNELVLMALT